MKASLEVSPRNLRCEEVQEELIINETNKIRKALGYKRFNAIGSDEVGTGDVFGPVVVCSAYVSIKDYDFLEKLNVRDSKLMTDTEIIKIAPTLIENIKHQVIKISPEKYNKAIKQGFNMNSIKAMLHNKAFLKLTKEIKKEENNFKVILDQFCLPEKYFEYLEGQDEIYKNIEFHTQAENMHLSVAVGAIIARYVFLKEMHNISQEVEYELPLGSQKTADYALQVLIQKHGIEILEKTAKTNFKNIKRIL